jgi:hypothetical protein
MDAVRIRESNARVMKNEVFRWTRDVPREWSDALSRVAPPEDRTDHLRLVWVPGDYDTPVQRWVVYQYVPDVVARPDQIPPVASITRDVIDRHVPTRVLAGDVVVPGYTITEGPNEEQAFLRDVLRSTACIAYPLWVCQGDPLGHPFQLTRWEKVAAMRQRGPTIPPRPGDAPYMPFYPDLVVPMLVRRSILGRRLASAEAERNRLEEEERRKTRAAFAGELDTEVTAAVHDAAHDLNAGKWTRPVHESGWEHGSADEDAAHYIETGALPPVAA